MLSVSGESENSHDKQWEVVQCHVLWSAVTHKQGQRIVNLDNRGQPAGQTPKVNRAQIPVTVLKRHLLNLGKQRNILLHVVGY